MAGIRLYRVVTTCSKAGFEQYGKRMLNSLYKFWPTDVDVKFYSENVPYAVPMPAWLNEFKAKHANNKAAHGLLPRSGRTMPYNYRFDAVRFAHKTAAVIDAAERALADKSADDLIWLDADTVTHAPVTLAFLREMSPGTSGVISWLWRSKTYPECGFYILNLRHAHTANLIAQWKSLYLTDRLFHLPEWHDSYVLQELVRSLRCHWRSISGNAANTSHPFVNGPLGAVMDHMKGDRKLVGHSKSRDLVVPRDEAYWKGIT